MIMCEFVTYDISKKLKEKGFNEPCFGWYHPSEIPGYDYRTLIVFNRSEYRYDRYDDLLIFHNDDKHIDAPTISQVLKWLREQRKINVEIFLYNGTYSYYIKGTTNICEDLSHQCLNDDTTEEEYNSYEEAAIAGIKYVLNNLI